MATTITGDSVSTGVVNQSVVPACRAGLTGNFVITSQDGSLINNFNTTNVGCFDTTSSMSASAYTVPLDGIYNLSVSMLFDAGGDANWSGLLVNVNGVTRLDFLGSNIATYVQYDRISSSSLLQLNQGDVITFLARDAGGNGFIYDVGNNGAEYSAISIHKVA